MLERRAGEAGDSCNWEGDFMTDWETVLRVGLALPEVERSTWSGTPSLKVRGKSFVRLKEEDVIVAMVDLDEKEVLMASEPDAFFQTPHYEGYPAVLVRPSALDEAELTEVLTESWRRKAPKKLLRDFDGGHLPRESS